jgi:hypothetical protein
MARTSTARRPLLLAASALAATGAALLPLSCGGNAGVVGIGIATLGISAILPGSSPGWRVADTRFLEPRGGVPSGFSLAVALTTTASPSDPIVLAPGERLDRVIVCGGGVSDRVEVRARASASGVASTLEARLLLTPWANGGGNALELAVDSAAVPAGAPDEVRLELDFSRVAVGTATLAEVETDPGDALTIRFENTGAGAITIDTSATRIDYGSRGTRGTRLDFRPDRGGGFEISGTPRARLVANAGAAAILEALTPLVVVGRGQTALVRVLVKDSGAQPVPGAVVDVQALGASQAPSKAQANADGIATAQVRWDAVGPFQVTFTASGAAGTPGEVVDVDVVQGTTRDFDGLVSFQAPVGQPVSAGVALDVSALLDVGGSTFETSAPATTFPDQVLYELARDVTSSAEWRFDIAARTTSFLSTATARFAVRIEDAAGGVVAQSPVQRADRGLRRFQDVMLEAKRLAIPASGGAASPSSGPAFRVAILVIDSSDPASPGLEVVTDASVGSHVRVPGPVVFARVGGRAFLASSPDPRR